MLGSIVDKYFDTFKIKITHKDKVITFKVVVLGRTLCEESIDMKEVLELGE